MITLYQALTADEFHYGKCKRIVGPRGGVKLVVERWRRNGKTREWKREPGRFRAPVKRGMRGYGYITDDMAWEVHTYEDCPLNAHQHCDCDTATCCIVVNGQRCGEVKP